MDSRITHNWFFFSYYSDKISDQSNPMGEQFGFARSLWGTVYQHREGILGGSGDELVTIFTIRKQKGNRKLSQGIQLQFYLQ